MTKYLFVSDLHSGSNFGIMPSEVPEEIVVGGDRIIHKPSKSQEWLLERWMEMIDNVGRIDVCVVNGDTCDGLHRKGQGYMLYTTNLDVQVQAATDLLKMVKAKKYCFTMGSGYHVGENMSLDEAVSQRIKPFADSQFGMDLAIVDPNKVAGKTDVEGKDEQRHRRIHASHKVGVSTTSWQYRSTPLAKELVMALLNEEEYGKFDVLVRSHAHYYCMVEFGSHFAVITPGWQLRTPFEVTGGLALLPKVGYFYMEVDKNGEIWKDKRIWSPKNPIKEVRV